MQAVDCLHTMAKGVCNQHIRARILTAKLQSLCKASGGFGIFAHTILCSAAVKSGSFRVPFFKRLFKAICRRRKRAAIVMHDGSRKKSFICRLKGKRLLEIVQCKPFAVAFTFVLIDRVVLAIKNG